MGHFITAMKVSVGSTNLNNDDDDNNNSVIYPRQY